MFRVPTRTHIGPGSRHLLAPVLDALGAQRVLVISDAGVAATPWLAEVSAAAATIGFVDVRTHVSANPRAAEVDALADKVRSGGHDVVVGLGGGSALDAAKAVAMLATNPGSIAAYEGRERFAASPLPFVAIPTTAGTGSEVTWVSVVSRPDEGRKISVKGRGMFPDVALVDADVLQTVPSHLLASTGMDALTHAIEAIVVRPANPASTALATDAVGRLLDHLAPLVSDPSDDVAREAVMAASTLAGMAFGNADVGAVHCLSESVGGLLDLPHGVLNAALLPPVLRAQMDTIGDRLATLDARTGGDGSAAGFVDRVQALHTALGLPTWSALGVDPALHARIGELAAANGSNASNLQTWTAPDYAGLLDALS